MKFKDNNAVAAMNAVAENIKINGDDPAPSATTLPMGATMQSVRNITATAADELRKLRDDVDRLLRTISVREQALMDAITEHAAFAEDSVTATGIMAESVRILRGRFEAGRSPVPPTVSLPNSEAVR